MRPTATAARDPEPEGTARCRQTFLRGGNAATFLRARQHASFALRHRCHCLQVRWVSEEPRIVTMADNEATGGARPLRFGVVAPLRTDPPAWRDQVRRIADSGYSTLLMPDIQQWQPVPGPTLAVAATLADLRVGTWVYASPLRTPRSMAWEAHSLSVLTEGRFEMGIGTGRPGIEDELRELGLPVVTPGERLSQVRDAVTSLRELDGPDLHTPVVMAVRGPKARALAVDLADTVTFAVMS